MDRKKEDRRVKYTKMVLKESFIQLLEKKSISKITIKEICENADINRATFYTHYTDQYDLLSKIQDELFESLKGNLDLYAQEGLTTNTISVVEQIFEYIKDNAKMCRLMLGERGDLDCQKRIFMLAYDKQVSEMMKHGGMSKADAEYFYAFLITGCVGVIQKWFNDDLRKSPRTIAELVIKITSGLQELLQREKNDI